MAIKQANSARRKSVQTLKNKVRRRAPIVESKGSKRMKESLAFLIEDALERSEVVIAAESIVEKLQGMAEDLSTIEAKDIMPLFDALTNAFGPQVAQKFNATATEQIRQLVSAVQSAKAAMDGEILRLKQGVETGEVSDMSMDAAATPMMPSVEPGSMPMGGLSDAPPSGDMSGDDLGIPGGAGPAIGRDKKESAQPKGKPIRTNPRKVAEDVDVPRSHESHNFGPNLSNLSLFHGGAGRLATSIANMIRTDELSETQRKGLASVLSHLAAFAAEPAHWSGVDADKKLEMALQSAGIWKVDSPALMKIVPQLKRLSHLLAAKHDGMLESNIKMLRTTPNPDALILKTFRVSLAENRDGQMAAIRTARTFAIDVEDVVAVVKEAAARRPFKEAPEYTQQLQGGGDDLTQDIPMFPVEQGGPAQAGAMPTAPNANAVQPMTMQPANQSNSTNKPLSPGDMRMRQAQQAQQAQAGAAMPGQTPPAQAQQANKQAMPPNPAQPAAGQPQPAVAPVPGQPQPQQQQAPQSQFKAPGQAMNKNDPALRRAAR